jgi:hypothetical protein
VGHNGLPGLGHDIEPFQQIVPCTVQRNLHEDQVILSTYYAKLKGHQYIMKKYKNQPPKECSADELAQKTYRCRATEISIGYSTPLHPMSNAAKQMRSKERVD